MFTGTTIHNSKSTKSVLLIRFTLRSDITQNYGTLLKCSSW